MSSFGYRLIGLFVWRAVRWYLHSHMPSRRKLVLWGLAGAAGVWVVATLAHRASA